MAQVENGNTVQVHYKGTLTDGTVFDSSEGRDPLEFKMGEGQIIPGFEKAVMGMEVGGKTDVSIKPEDAYGEKRDDLIIPVPKADFPDDIRAEKGLKIQMGDNQGNTMIAEIIDITDESIVLDANHMLAGETLNFAIEVVDIK